MAGVDKYTAEWTIGEGGKITIRSVQMVEAKTFTFTDPAEFAAVLQLLRTKDVDFDEDKKLKA